VIATAEILKRLVRYCDECNNAQTSNKDNLPRTPHTRALAISDYRKIDRYGAKRYPHVLR
jgi:hypothetical protein